MTNARRAATNAAAGQIGPAYPAVARTNLASALASLSALTELRALAHTEMSALPLITHYTNVIAALLHSTTTSRPAPQARSSRRRSPRSRR